MTEYIKSQGRRPRRHQAWIMQLFAGEGDSALPTNPQAGALDRPAPQTAPTVEERRAARRRALRPEPHPKR